MNTILVTGDLVLDHHLYEGDRLNKQDAPQRDEVRQICREDIDSLRSRIGR